LFGFHDFKPPFKGSLDIMNSFFIGFPLGKTSGRGRDFGYIISSLILFDDDMSFHGSSCSS
jgi:hypothetical protein